MKKIKPEKYILKNFLKLQEETLMKLIVISKGIYITFLLFILYNILEMFRTIEELYYPWIIIIILGMIYTMYFSSQLLLSDALEKYSYNFYLILRKQIVISLIIFLLIFNLNFKLLIPILLYIFFYILFILFVKAIYEKRNAKIWIEYIHE